MFNERGADELNWAGSKALKPGELYCPNITQIEFELL